jgi:hypothetical protein
MNSPYVQASTTATSENGRNSRGWWISPGFIQVNAPGNCRPQHVPLAGELEAGMIWTPSPSKKLTTTTTPHWQPEKNEQDLSEWGDLQKWNQLVPTLHSPRIVCHVTGKAQRRNTGAQRSFRQTI